MGEYLARLVDLRGEGEGESLPELDGGGEGDYAGFVSTGSTRDSARRLAVWTLGGEATLWGHSGERAGDHVAEASFSVRARIVQGFGCAIGRGDDSSFKATFILWDCLVVYVFFHPFNYSLRTRFQRCHACYIFQAFYLGVDGRQRGRHCYHGTITMRVYSLRHCFYHQL